MKQFYTVVLDRFKDFSGTYATEPYECGWADEAIAYFTIHQLAQGAVVKAKIQIAMDGIHWHDNGEVLQNLASEGYYLLKVAPNFGGWLRIEFESTGSCILTPSLALKG